MTEWADLLASIPRDVTGKIRPLDPPLRFAPDAFELDASFFGVIAKLEPQFALSFENAVPFVTIKRNDDGALDVELGEHVTLTEAARAFIDEVRRQLRA